MAKKDFKSSADINQSLREENIAHEKNIELINRELVLLKGIFGLREKTQLLQEKFNAQQQILLNYAKEEVSIGEKGKHIRKDKLKQLKKQEDLQKKIVNQTNEELKKSEKKLLLQQSLLSSLKTNGNLLKSAYSSITRYLMESDSAMKSLSLEFGLSGERSEMMRENLMDSAGFAARMGISMKELTQMVSTYADETGRVRQFNKENTESLTLMAKGTNLGVEGAARMAGQFEMMGLNATDTAGEVQRILDTSERMGVNTSKVFKVVNANFKKLQKYNFKDGVSSMANMAIYAEKFKINMAEVFAPLEKGRSLESVIEMSAQLQVLGGNFANLSDPMSMLFESRNDPEAYMKRINEMTKGMVTLNKTAEGFQFEMASPMAQDMLAKAAKALGMSTDELTQQAFRMREIQQTRSQMSGKGFTKDEKDMIEGLAKFDKNSGRMFVEIGGVATDVANLGDNQLKALTTEQSTLKERAIASQTFSDAFKNTIEELKATFLPMLKGINEALAWLRPIVTDFTSWFGELGGIGKTMTVVAGLFISAAALWLKNITFAKLSGLGKTRGTSLIGGKSGNAAQMLGKGKMAAGVGKGSMMKGLGVGGAALGIGAGIGIAAAGISKLADSMAKLDETQIWALPATIGALAVAIAAFTIPMAILGPLTTAGSLGLLALGASALGIGAGIGLAAMGIGQMAEGLSLLKDVDMLSIGVGIAAIGAGAVMGTLGMVGMAGMAASVLVIASTADDMERVGSAFGNISAVMKGTSSDLENVKETVKAITSMDIDGNSGIASLASVLSKPLKVEFADKDIAFVANIDLSIDGKKFMDAANVNEYVKVRQNDSNAGKATK